MNDFRECGNMLYVSLTGDDMAEGTLEQPLCTLQGAREKVRAIKAKGLPAGGLTVNIRGGEYSCLKESFLLEEQDSGTADSPIVYRAYEGEEVKLTGNIFVDGSKFVPIEDEAVLARLNPNIRDKVLVYDLKKENNLKEFAPLPKNGFGWQEQASAMSVLIDGKPQLLARYPKEGFLEINEILDSGFIPRNHMANPDGTCPECTKLFGNGKRISCRYGESGFLKEKGGIFTVNGEEIKARYAVWKQEEDMWTGGYFFWEWADDSSPVGTIEETDAGIKFTMKQPSRYGVGREKRTCYFFNLLCEIDRPGEWYLDRSSGKLYLYPAGDLKECIIEITMQAAPLMSMNKVRNVKCQGITFAGANGHGIVMKDCENVEIAGCSFRELGQRAVFMGNPDDMDFNIGAHGGNNNVVRSCDITRTGQGGIYMGGGNRYTLTPGNNKVMNCDISDYATIKRTYSPAVEISGCGNIVERNRIYDAPHTAILYKGNDMRIEGNEIFHVCYETSDAGAVYNGRMWSAQGTVIRNNYIHDIISWGNLGSSAVYVDDLGSGITMTENLLVNIQGYTALIGGGHDNVITNNIQINNGDGRGIHYDNRGLNWAWYLSAGPDGECYGEVRKLRSHPDFDEKKWKEKYPRLAELDLNATEIREEKGEGYRDYYVEAAKPTGAFVKNNILVGVKEPLENISKDARDLGLVENNQIYPKGTDIGFRNAAKGDFGVAEQCIIKECLGNRHFDAAAVGLYADEFRK